MNQKVALERFRSVFRVVDKEALTWFPGHMGKGLKQMQQKLRQIDCIIEVHDARIPFTGRNNEFKHKIGGIKPHILVMNKKDLIDDNVIPETEERLKMDCPNVIFTNCKDQQCHGVKQIFPLAQRLVKNSDRYNRSQEADFCLMVIGVPNVGKSSLINTLRNRHLRRSNASAVGAVPGITRSVLNKIKISENPLIYVLDTPGILQPQVTNTEVGLKLALCATIGDHLVGESVIADYLLFWLNKQRLFQYVDFFRLDGPTDDIVTVLAKIATNQNKILRLRDTSNIYIQRPDFNWAAKFVVRSFRAGELGKIMLDSDLLCK